MAGLSKEAKSKIAKATSRATAKVKEAAAAGSAKLRNLRANAKTRRMVDAGEVVAGGLVGGALDGMDLGIEITDTIDLPLGLVGGVAAVAIGSFMKQEDVQAVGLGLATYGAGAMVREFIK